MALYSPLYSSASTISIPLDSNFVSPGFGAEFGEFQSFTADADCTAAAGQAEVQVRKLVAGGLNAGQSFAIIVREDNGGEQDLTLPANGIGSVCVTMGFEVVEPFSAVSASDECQEDTVVPGNTYHCTLTNAGAFAESFGQLNVDTATTAEQALNQLRQSSTPGTELGLTAGPQVDVGPTQPTASAQGRAINPPTTTCLDNKVTGQNTVVRAPSSMKIVVYGKVNLNQVQDALKDLDTSRFHVAIASDLDNADGVSASVSNPQFTGYIIVQDDKGLKQEIIKYNILDFRRECSYIALAKAAGPATNANVATLGELGDPERANLQPSEIDELLVGGAELRGGTAPANSLTFNPPLAECTLKSPARGEGATRVEAIAGDAFAIYNIRGVIVDRDAKAFDENNLLIEATVDLNQADTDVAKLVDNNNPLIRVDLLTQEYASHESRIERIGFTLADVWTDCKQIALTTESVFDPFINELNY